MFSIFVLKNKKLLFKIGRIFIQDPEYPIKLPGRLEVWNQQREKSNNKRRYIFKIYINYRRLMGYMS